MALIKVFQQLFLFSFGSSSYQKQTASMNIFISMQNVIATGKVSISTRIIHDSLSINGRFYRQYLLHPLSLGQRRKLPINAGDKNMWLPPPYLVQ